MQDLNRVSIIGRLTRDPELRSLPSGQSVCELRLAFSSSRKTDHGWEDESNFINVTVFGAQGESAASHLAKGRQVAVDGRLRWREWEKDGAKREQVSISAQSVQFLGEGRSERSSQAESREDEIPF